MLKLEFVHVLCLFPLILVTNSYTMLRERNRDSSTAFNVEVLFVSASVVVIPI